MAGVIVVNRGKRSYSLRKGPAGEERTLVSGGSIETLDESEAKMLLRYHDIQDIAQAAPQTAARMKEQREEIDRLKAENEKLKPAPKPEKHVNAPVPEPALSAHVPARRGAYKKGR